MDLLTSMKTPLEQLSHFAENKPQTLVGPSSLVEVTFKSAPLSPLRGGFAERKSQTRVKRVAAALTRNSLDAAERQARALLGAGMFSPGSFKGKHLPRAGNRLNFKLLYVDTLGFPLH